MMNTALMDNERVRRTSAGNLLDDPEAAATGQPTVRKASLPGLGLSALAAGVEIEDAYAEIGGLGWYQLWHMGVLVCFWFFNVLSQAVHQSACDSSGDS